VISGEDAWYALPFVRTARVARGWAALYVAFVSMMKARFRLLPMGPP
jgi:hypothetical protein